MAPIGPGEIEARFDARQVLTMAMRLPVSQIEALAESTDLREAGLRAARNGAVADGRRLVASARENRCCVILETEADLLFETYQQAAEAFLAYRDGQFDRAYLQMRLAISHANRLRQDYAYPTELRRVHLGANLLRVSVAAGDWPRAVTQGLGLLGYLLGRRQDWPWPDLTLQDADLISVEERLFLLDQIEGPAEQALRQSGDSDLLTPLAQQARESGRDPVSLRILSWATAAAPVLTPP